MPPRSGVAPGSAVSQPLGLLPEPLNPAALGAHERRGGPVGPVQADEGHPHGVEQDGPFSERVVATVRAPDGLTLDVVAPGPGRLGHRLEPALERLEEVAHTQNSSWCAAQRPKFSCGSSLRKACDQPKTVVCQLTLKKPRDCRRQLQRLLRRQAS